MMESNCLRLEHGNAERRLYLAIVWEEKLGQHGHDNFIRKHLSRIYGCGCSARHNASRSDKTEMDMETLKLGQWFVDEIQVLSEFILCVFINDCR